MGQLVDSNGEALMHQGSFQLSIEPVEANCPNKNDSVTISKHDHILLIESGQAPNGGRLFLFTNGTTIQWIKKVPSAIFLTVTLDIFL